MEEVISPLISWALHLQQTLHLLGRLPPAFHPIGVLLLLQVSSFRCKTTPWYHIVQLVQHQIYTEYLIASLFYRPTPHLCPLFLFQSLLPFYQLYNACRPACCLQCLLFEFWPHFITAHFRKSFFSPPPLHLTNPLEAPLLTKHLHTHWLTRYIKLTQAATVILFMPLLSTYYQRVYCNNINAV